MNIEGGAKRRAHGQGSIYTEQRHHQVTYVAQRRMTLPNGKKVRLKARGVSEVEAWLRLADKVKKVEQTGHYRPRVKRHTVSGTGKSVRRRKSSTPRPDWTFQEYANHFYDNRTGVSAEGVYNERRTLERHVFDHIGHVPMSQVSKKVMAKFFNDLYYGEKSQMTGLHNNVWKILSKVFHHAIRQDVIKINPLDGVERKKAARKDRKVEIAQKTVFVRQMLDWMNNSGWAQQHPLDNAMFRLNLMGLRTAELVGVTVTNYNNQHDVGLVIDTQFKREAGGGKAPLTIKKQTKTGVVRRIPLPQSVKKALADYYDIRRDLNPPRFKELLFIDPHTLKPIEPNAYRDKIRTIIEQYFWDEAGPNANIYTLCYGFYVGGQEQQGQTPESFKDFCANPPALFADFDGIKLRDLQPPNITPKDMRAIATTMMLDAGISQPVVEQIMGNSQAVQAKHYYFSQTSAQAQALENLMNHYYAHDDVTHVSGMRMVLAGTKKPKNDA